MSYSACWGGKIAWRAKRAFNNNNEILIYRTYHRSLMAVYNSFQAWMWKPDHNTGNYVSYSCEQCVGSLTSHKVIMNKGCETGPIFELRMKDQIEERSSQLLRNLSSCEKKAWKKFRLERDIYLHSFIHPSRVYYELTIWPAPSWLDSSVGRALHRHRRGHGSVPAWIFFRLSFRNCEDLSSIWSFIRSSNICFIYLHSFIHPSRVYYELTIWPAPSWLDSSVGRALHRHRRGHGFEPEFFSGFLFATA